MSWRDPVRAMSRSPYALLSDAVAFSAVPLPAGSAATQLNTPPVL
jgi:hypothetical protein